MATITKSHFTSCRRFWLLLLLMTNGGGCAVNSGVGAGAGSGFGLSTSGGGRNDYVCRLSYVFKCKLTGYQQVFFSVFTVFR